MLTRRENQVLLLVVDGATNAQIAHGFGLSADTISQHLGSIRQKLDVANRTELAAFALRKGLVDGRDEARPATIEVEWGQGDEVLDIRFRYLTAEGERRAPETQKAMLDASFAGFQGPDWTTSASSLVEALQAARHTDEAIRFSGAAGRLEETGGDFSWAGSISRISDSHYLNMSENFPKEF